MGGLSWMFLRNSGLLAQTPCYQDPRALEWTLWVETRWTDVLRAAKESGALHFTQPLASLADSVFLVTDASSAIPVSTHCPPAFPHCQIKEETSSEEGHKAHAVRFF